MITLADAILAASFAVDVVCGHQLKVLRRDSIHKLASVFQ
jgi:hypothetical protein